MTGGLRVVRGGLRPDDRVVINGGGRIRPGMPVQARAGQIPAPTPAPTPDKPDLPVARTATSAATPAR